MRSSAGMLSFRRIYARTPPWPWTQSGGIVPPMSPTRGDAEYDYSVENYPQ
jgi:hypothetical protein